MRQLLLFQLALMPILMIAQDINLPSDAVHPDWKKEIPQVVYPDNRYVELYNKTWEIAAGRVRKGPIGTPSSPYLDENCYDDQIWIWDGCFMVMFSKYAPNAYPGKETLMNYYMPIHDHVKTPLRIHLRDNPPLFAWVEHDNYIFTGDQKHIKQILEDKQYLQRHFEYFNNIPKGDVNKDISPEYNPIHRGVVRDPKGNIIGYTWTGGASGMDNTPRGRDKGGYNNILWIDAISQQALSAQYIAELLRLTGNIKDAQFWNARYDSIKKIVNENYWDDQEGFYFDIDTLNKKPCRIKTPASFWAMLAGIPSKKQAARMVEYLKSDKYMGGYRPWVSLSRDDKDYNDSTGDYWRGGIWLPMVYMGTKALQKYGYYDLADELAEHVVNQQLRTYYKITPHTIWEVYSPSDDAPSTEHGRRARPDFCGWSALGPISLFIENIMGFYDINALTNTVKWRLKSKNDTHGIKNLHFGNVTTDIVYNNDTKMIETKSNMPYTLIVNNRTYKVSAGDNIHKAPTLL